MLRGTDSNSGPHTLDSAAQRRPLCHRGAASRRPAKLLQSGRSELPVVSSRKCRSVTKALRCCSRTWPHRYQSCKRSGTWLTTLGKSHRQASRRPFAGATRRSQTRAIGSTTSNSIIVRAQFQDREVALKLIHGAIRLSAHVDRKRSRPVHIPNGRASSATSQIWPRSQQFI